MTGALVALASALAVACVESTPQFFYASPQGSDANNGTLAAPFATVQRGFSAVSALKSANGGSLPSPVNINLLGGTYFLSQSINVNSSSGGDANAGVTVAGMDGATISGGSVISGWVPIPGTTGVYTAAIPSAAGFARSLYSVADSVRRSVQRSPYYYYTNITYEPTTTTIVAAPGQFSPSLASQVADANVYVYHSWTSAVSPIHSFDAATNAITVGRMGDHFDGASGNRYSLVNVADISTLEPGSFLYISANSSVVYRAFPGEDPRNPQQALIAPVLSNLLTVAGSDVYTGAVQSLAFVNVSFAHSSEQLESQCISGGCCDQSGSDLSQAAIFVANSTGIVFDGVTVTHTGGYAMWMRAGTQQSSVLRSTFNDVGAGGIRIGEANSGAAPNAAYLVSNITVADTRIFDGGHVVEAGVGIFLQQATQCTIEHNLIHDLYYTGISTGWTWGYAPTSNDDLYVAYNEMYNLGRDRLSDMGCIYNLGTSVNTTFVNNLCYNISTYGYGGWGYYDDEGTSDVFWSNNIVYNTKSAGFHQHYGVNNIIDNNIVAFPGTTYCDDTHTCDNAGVRSSQHPPNSGPGAFSSFTFTHNIVLLDVLNSTLFYTTMPTGFENMTLGSNVYWSTALSSPLTQLQFPPTQAPTTWTQWLAEGKDAGSVIADPHFVNAGAFDFTHLQPTSPALRLGFQPIDMSTVGPRL